jgi:hypothetical protein
MLQGSYEIQLEKPCPGPLINNIQEENPKRRIS